MTAPTAAAEHFVDDLEMELTDALLEDFQLEAEDGSPRQVAGSLIALYQACCRNDAGPLQQLRQRAAAGASGTAASKAVAVSWHAQAGHGHRIQALHGRPQSTSSSRCQ